MNQSHEIRSFGLNKEAKWAIFVSNKGQGLKRLAAHPYPNSLWMSPKGDQILNISAIKYK